jgi:hypothetical protein
MYKQWLDECQNIGFVSQTARDKAVLGEEADASVDGQMPFVAGGRP